MEVFIEVCAGSTECRKYNEQTFEYRCSRYPDMDIRLGEILPADKALAFIGQYTY